MIEAGSGRVIDYDADHPACHHIADHSCRSAARHTSGDGDLNGLIARFAKRRDEFELPVNRQAAWRLADEAG